MKAFSSAYLNCPECWKSQILSTFEGRPLVYPVPVTDHDEAFHRGSGRADIWSILGSTMLCSALLLTMTGAYATPYSSSQSGNYELTTWEASHPVMLKRDSDPDGSTMSRIFGKLDYVWEGLTGRLLSPTTTYTSFQNDTYVLIPWEGTHVVVLTRNSADGSTMSRIVGKLDDAWAVYEDMTGRVPTPIAAYTLDGRSTIAEVPDGATCGAGCAYLGSTGIELTSTSWDVLYNGVNQNNEYDQVLFYELGRNFWLYDNQLKAINAFVTGFAIANRFVSMTETEAAGAPFGILPFDEFQRLATVDLITAYGANSDLDWRSTLGNDSGVPGQRFDGSADLAGAMMHRVYEDHGYAAYRSFWREMNDLPLATTIDEAMANFINAAYLGTGQDYRLLLKATDLPTPAPEGLFTPVAGTIIQSKEVTIEWISAASQQWVRAYDSNGANIFDSGRQSSSAGTVGFTVAASETQLRVFFYEKNASGNWIAYERTYSVAIDGGDTEGGDTGGGDTGGGDTGGTTPAGITLNDLNCTTGQLAQYDSGTWVCATIAAGAPGPAGADGMDAQLPTYSLGATGPAGGFVFYVTDDGLHGYEAAPVDQSSSVEFGCDGSDVTDARGISIGSGKHNTDHLVTECGAGTAADLADAYNYQGYNDWFLPSKDTLNLMYENLHLLGQGDFGSSLYWSSSEVASGIAWSQLFGSGAQYDVRKDNTLRVRAVRSF